ncbi:MAG: hypothetical protein R3C44_24445 [Chloroflexota bacterium]
MTAEPVQCPRGFFFEGQFAHLLLLVGLVAGAFYLAEPALGDGSWLGIGDTAWFIAMLVAVAVIGVCLVRLSCAVVLPAFYPAVRRP